MQAILEAYSTFKANFNDKPCNFIRCITNCPEFSAAATSRIPLGIVIAGAFYFQLILTLLVILLYIHTRRQESIKAQYNRSDE